MKHAYLIIAHNEFEVLQRLVKALDDPRNDIYVHIDKKVKVLPELHAELSNLYVLEKRIDVRWGHVSQIKTELLLFETALENGPYEYYHLISGTHLPLKSQDEIHSFFEENRGKEIMRLWEYDARDVGNKLRTYHLWMRWYNSSTKFIRCCVQFFWCCNLKVQRILGVRRNSGTIYIKADNWVSLTHDAVRYLVESEKQIINRFRMTFCGDEYFVPTELNACGDRFIIKNTPNLLYVKFTSSNAGELDAEDVTRLLKSDFLFARKFVSGQPDVLRLLDITI